MQGNALWNGSRHRPLRWSVPCRPSRQRSRHGSSSDDRWRKGTRTGSCRNPWAPRPAHFLRNVWPAMPAVARRWDGRTHGRATPRWAWRTTACIRTYVRLCHHRQTPRIIQAHHSAACRIFPASHRRAAKSPVGDLPPYHRLRPPHFLRSISCIITMSVRNATR